MWKPELLAPAGSLEKLKVAVLYGADAVYLSGQNYGMRASADNFTNSEIELGIKFAHKHNAKAYVALNGFLHDSDLEDLGRYCSLLETNMADAVIASDLGVVETVREYSSLPVFLSTQASCLNSQAAALWRDLGVKRIILGRETSIAEARLIREKTGLEVEIFIHGAMCMSYSGCCAISNYTAGRDANRGGCIQSCRFEYRLSHGTQSKELTKKLHFMSSKDLCGIELTDKIFENKITSLKIEGRMKSLLYVATVTSAYRRAIDAFSKGELSPKLLEELSNELETMPHRDYTEASLLKTAGSDSVYLSNIPPANNAAHKMLGLVLESSEQFGLVSLYQPIRLGDQAEILSFSGKAVPFPIRHITNGAGDSVERSRQATVVKLKLPPETQEFNLLRIRNEGASHAG